MARLVHERLGATVITSSFEEESLDIDEKMIKKFVGELGFDAYELYFAGHSDGAYHNLKLAERFKQTKKMLAINPSFIGEEEFVEKLNKLVETESIFVYGDRDADSYKLVEAIRENGARPIKTLEISGADHDFTNMLDEYINLINLL
jgi:alpha/beta superfamily hydrolase